MKFDNKVYKNIFFICCVLLFMYFVSNLRTKTTKDFDREITAKSSWLDKEINDIYIFMNDGQGKMQILNRGVVYAARYVNSNYQNKRIKELGDSLEINGWKKIDSSRYQGYGENVFGIIKPVDYHSEILCKNQATIIIHNNDLLADQIFLSKYSISNKVLNNDVEKKMLVRTSIELVYDNSSPCYQHK